MNKRTVPGSATSRATASCRVEVDDNEDRMMLRLSCGHGEDRLELARSLQAVAAAVAEFEQNDNPAAIERFFRAQIGVGAAATEEILLTRDCKSASGVGRLAVGLIRAFSLPHSHCPRRQPEPDRPGHHRP